MATEYVVTLRNLVSGPAGEALRDVNRLRAGLGSLEATKTTVGVRAAGTRSARGTSDSAARNAAFRRLREAQREEERFARYRISLMRREVAERERAERQMLAAELRRIRAAQRAEASARRASSARAGHIGSVAGSMLGGVAGAAGSGIAAGVGVALAGAAYAGKQGLDTAKMVENARMRLTAQLGSVEAANAEIKDAFRIAEKTIFNPKEVLDALSQLSTNFKDTDVRRYVMAAVSDFATVSGKGEEGMKSAIIAINQVVAKGKLQAEELTGQLGELGLPARKVYAELATILKVTGADDQARTDKVIKMITAGKVDSNAAVTAITKVMRDMSGGGPAGQFAVQSADTLEGIISNIQGGFSSLFAMSDAEKWPSLVAMKDLLRDVASFFSVDSKAGQAAMASIRDALTKYALPAIERLRKSFASFVGDPARMDNFIRGLVGLGQRILWVAEGFGYVVEKVISFYGWIRSLDEALGFSEDWSSRLYERFISVGSAIGRGIIDGIKSVGTRVYDTIGSLATGAVDTIKAKLGIASPSRVMAQLGSYTGEGFARGIEGGAGRVLSASRALGDAAATGVGGRTVVAARGAGAGSRGGHVVNVSITLPVQTAADPAELARQAAPLLGARIEVEMDRYFGRLAAQGV